MWRRIISARQQPYRGIIALISSALIISIAIAAAAWQ